MATDWRLLSLTQPWAQMSTIEAEGHTNRLKQICLHVTGSSLRSIATDLSVRN